MVFKGKLGDREQVSSYKASLVAKLFFRKKEKDCFENFAPVVLFDSLLLQIGKLATRELVFHHADILTAFLNGEFKMDLFSLRLMLCPS